MKKTTSILIHVLIILLLAGCASTQKSIYDFGIDLERNRSDLIYKTTKVDGNPVSYLERAGQGETIVLVHGFTADKNNWIRFVRYLPDPYHVLVIDMPGHGDSVLDADRTYTPFDLSRGVEKTLNSIGAKRFHIAGNSLGGLVSKVFAAEHTDRVITLGLFNSAGVNSPEPSEFRKLLEKGENPFVVHSREDYDTLNGFAFHDEPYLPWPVHSVMARRYIQRNDFHQRIFRDLLASKLFYETTAQQELLSHLKMPVFVIWGDHDKLLHVSSVDVYQKELPQAETVILENCGHLPMLERPEESAMRYTEFLRKHSEG